MADKSSQNSAVKASVSEEATKKAGVSENTTQTKTDSADENTKKTEDAAADAGSTASQSRPTKHLPTHFRGMPRQWEKNQGEYKL